MLLASLLHSSVIDAKNQNIILFVYSASKQKKMKPMRQGEFLDPHLLAFVYVTEDTTSFY